MTTRAWWWLVLLGVLWPAAAVGAQEESLIGRRQELARQAELVGRWQAELGGERVDLRLNPDWSYQLDGERGTYDVLPDKQLLLGTDAGVVTYKYELAGDQLTLTGGDLAEPLALIRRVDVAHYVSALFNITPEGVWERAYRILFIIAVVVVARLIIAGLRAISTLLISLDRGPLGWFYPNNKNRARTVHALVLNLAKYFIYFTALGMILSELGVNYATYFASLSVIGLAVGFGSQGLVQDMVTGFFIIFEGQFDVGDMVEISGQTGVVTELGLRMTKLRNYFGQIVVIPNRNIAVVGNYSRGAQRAYVDAAVEDAEAGKRAAPALERLGQELMKQYPGVVLGPVRVTGPTALETGEHFVRLHLSIWPGQTWVMDQQLVPRLREQFARQEIKIPGDRVQVFYHARERVPVAGWSSRLPWAREASGPAAR